MKKYLIIFSITSLAILTTACGTPERNQTTEDPVQTGQGSNNEEVTNGAANEAPNQEDMQNKIDELDYTDFELEVEYADHKEYEAEIEKSKHDQTIDAEIEDDINGVKKKGEEAFNELYPLVKKLTIDKQTSKEDAIKETLDVFDLSTDYKKIEIEITFNDGTKIEFEDRK
ncbi:hypothetical protein DCC39_12675 [Pueribacillus theae]|uniref:YusW-like protein n=1 Tax=Pueribacillus theae TaxID=2171751 RepID=A0A2U1JWW1_9BACI|nr:YusW family protein [Pueribacillus theae]PWA09691.1 hypothetical protein DCC39_12675 [Pueribacillus theae]